MGINITMSQRSQELMMQYWSMNIPFHSEKFPVSTSLDLNLLAMWFDDNSFIFEYKPEEPKQEIEFLILSLRAELLHDLCAAMEGEEERQAIKTEEVSWDDKAKFILLTSAGILVAACEGFDSVVTMMSIFSLPAVIILISAFIVSFFSIVAFCGFDLVKVSNSLGVKLSEAHKVLDVYWHQFEEMTLIREKITNYNFSKLSVSQLQELQQIVAILQQRCLCLSEAGEQLDEVLNSRQVQIVRFSLTVVAASLFFGGGFCAGQTVSLFVLGFFITTISPASIPVMLFSILVGAAAFSLYWNVEFPGLKSLISGWFGLDEHRIVALSDKKILEQEAKSFAFLKEGLEGTCQLKERVEQQGQTKKELVFSSRSESSLSPTKVGNNIYSFLAAPKHKTYPADSILNESYYKSIQKGFL